MFTTRWIALQKYKKLSNTMELYIKKIPTSILHL